MKNFSKEAILAGCGYLVTYVDKQFCFRGDDGMNTDYFTLEICRIGLTNLVDTCLPCNATHISAAVQWIDDNVELIYLEGKVAETILL